MDGQLLICPETGNHIGTGADANRNFDGYGVYQDRTTNTQFARVMPGAVAFVMLPMTVHDSFSIDIALRHPSCTPEYISAALSIKARSSHKAGQQTTSLPKGWTHFYATLRKGDSPR